MIHTLFGRVMHKESLEPPRRGWRCPDETTLAGYVDARLPDSAKLHFERHLADCDYCLNQVATLTRLQAEEVPSEVPSELIRKARAIDERPQGESAVPMLRWGAVAGAAAAILLVVATTYRQPISSPPATPTHVPRPTVTPSVPPTSSLQPMTPRTVRNQIGSVPTVRLVYPREGSALSRNDMEFRWQRVPGAIYYDVRVVTQNGDLIWEARAEGTQARLPSSASLKVGDEFFVRVRAYLSEGKTITSRVVGFKVKGES